MTLRVGRNASITSVPEQVDGDHEHQAVLKVVGGQLERDPSGVVLGKEERERRAVQEVQVDAKEDCGEAARPGRQQIHLQHRSNVARIEYEYRGASAQFEPHF